MVIFSESSFQHNSVLLDTISKTMERKQDKITSIIELGIEDDSIRNDLNAMSIANIIMGSMRLIALRWKMSNFSFDLVDESKQLQQTIKLMIKNK